MKKAIVKISVLLTVFIISVTLTTLFMSSENTNNISELDPPTLPEILVDIDGVLTNCMYGYRQEMQGDFNRDSLTPVDTNRKISVVIKSNDQKISGLSYEVRTSDGTRVVENQSVKKLSESDGYLRAEIQLTSDNMLMNQEYSLQLKLDLEDGPAYYYSRIIQRSRLHAGNYVEFAQAFYQKCLNKGGAAELADYVEPDVNASNRGFDKINIHSSLDMITWGSLNPQISRQGTPIIKDINETTGSVLIRYQISARDNEGNRELYEVEDFYRMRYTQARILLLDFERETRQVFDGNLPVTDSTGIQLGITPPDIQYVSNPSADIVVFVQNGDLWSYSHSACKVTRIFSFRRDDNSDERDDNCRHNMKVLRVDESGDMDFVLYGYMNRGPHEGYVGTSVCHYSSTQNAVEELVFVPSTLSYEFLKRDLEKLSYVTAGGQLYLLTEGRLYQVDIPNQSYHVVNDSIDERYFACCTDQSRAAWASRLENGKLAITEMDFESGQTRTIKPGKGRYIQVLGYMNEDLIYGIANKNDVLQDVTGQTAHAMNSIRIENFDGTLKKEYAREGLYITDVNVTESLMELSLSEKMGDSYQFRTTENVMNNKKAVEETVTMNSEYTERRGNVIRLDFKQALSASEPVVVLAKVRNAERTHILDMGIEPQADEAYYVYARGRLDSVCESPAQAILIADEKTGVVLNRQQQYVWERGNKRTRIKLDVSAIPQEVRGGPLDPQQLQKALGDSASVLNLTGCTLDAVLYEVSMQRPVIAAVEGNKSLVIVGYDEYNTLVYDPATKETNYMGINDSTEAFEKAGNHFISCIDTIKE